MMTQYECLDLAASYHNSALAALMGYFSVLSAYFVVAYVAGGSMKRDQVIAAIGLFVIMALFMTWGAVQYWKAAWDLVGLSGIVRYNPFVPHVIALPLLIIGQISGLKFMWDVRHPKDE